jgi:hypothetical protein
MVQSLHRKERNMDRLRSILLDNVRNIARLEHYPTHRLRILHGASCVPEILHEARVLSSVGRLFSGDSRKTVLVAIEQTIQFLVENVSSSPPRFREELREYTTKFLGGLTAIQAHYAIDMDVVTVIERIRSVWLYLLGVISVVSCEPGGLPEALADSGARGGLSGDLGHVPDRQ